MPGSTAKPIVALVTLALASRGMLSLDGNVERWLGFAVRHPDHPDVAITPELLLGHRSGMGDDVAPMRASVVPGDSPVTLESWLWQRLQDRSVFTAEAPGAARRYSNTAIALAALVVERAARMPFPEVCEALLFEPLGIQRARWQLAHGRADELARGVPGDHDRAPGPRRQQSVLPSPRARAGRARPARAAGSRRNQPRRAARPRLV